MMKVDHIVKLIEVGAHGVVICEVYEIPLAAASVDDRKVL